MHRADHWQRDWARHLRACSEKAAEVARCASLAVLRAYEKRDDAVEAARTARERTAEASAKACNGGARGDGMRRSPDRVEQRRAARCRADGPHQLQVSKIAQERRTPPTYSCDFSTIRPTTTRPEWERFGPKW